MAVLQREIVGHAKDPSAQVSPGPPHLKMAKESQKNLLNDLFTVMSRSAKRKHVTQQPVTKFIKKADDLSFDF